MHTEDILILFAELAVALAGFAGIVGALDRRKFKQWGFERRLGFSTLIATSFGALLNCVFAMILLNAEIGSNEVWQIAGTFWIFSSLSVNLLLWKRFLKSGTRVTIAPVAYTVTIGIVVVLQIYNILILQLSWPYLVAVAVLLGSSATAFIQLVIANPKTNRNDETSA
jgi:hypothetical protein